MQRQHTRTLTRFLSGLGALVIVAGVAAQAILPGKAHAAPALQITSRSLTLEPGATAGGSAPGVSDTSAYYVNHLFSFTLNDTTDNLGSIVFQYCTTAAAVPGGTGCVAPTGIDTTNVALGSTSGVSGWNAPTSEAGWDDANDTVHNAVFMSRTAAKLTAATPTTIELDNIVNPSTANQTFFVRIWTFTATTITYTPSTGAPLDTTDANDSGTVAASTTNPVILSGTMPESLVFCTGHTINISTVTHLPDCTTATSGSVSFNQLFDPNTTSWAYSQMAASTNAGQGYQISVAGSTMTSGSNTIAAIGSTAAVSTPGVAQFGLNLIDDANPTAPIVTDPTIGTGSNDPITYYNGDGAGTGAAINPASDGTNYFALAAAGFDGSGGAGNAPTYAFDSTTANTVAKSNYGGTLKPTNSQRYTATYIVNVPGNQPAGTYSTTLTYICTATY